MRPNLWPNGTWRVAVRRVHFDRQRLTRIATYPFDHCQAILQPLHFVGQRTAFGRLADRLLSCVLRVAHDRFVQFGKLQRESLVVAVFDIHSSLLFSILIGLARGAFIVAITLRVMSACHAERL